MGQDHLAKSAKNSTKVLKTTNNKHKSTILISINPQHVRNIFNCSKKYEYRKRIAKNVKKLVIYETTPTKKIVGEVNVVEVLCLKPNKLWDKTKKWSGINRLFFQKYFNGSQVAYAYRLGSVKKYKRPKSLAQLNIKAAPQSYTYIFN